MTKKTFNQFLILISALLITSCLISGSSNNSDTDINDVLGNWSITKGSLKMIKSDENKTEDKIVSAFKLNSDSTATVIFGESERKTMNGTWTWQAEKQIGNKNLGLSLKSDVVIYVQGLYTLGLQLRQNGDKNKLIAGDYTFEKE